MNVELLTNNLFKIDESININNPECNFNMPDISEIMKIEYINISDNKYEFKFNINISNTSCIDLIYLYIHCDNCVEKVNGINKESEKHKVNVLLIRSGKKEINDQYISDFITEIIQIVSYQVHLVCQNTTFRDAVQKS